MENDEPADPENAPYGQLLGEYFSVASAIGDLEDRHDPEELDDNDEYAELLDRRRQLRHHLNGSSTHNADTEIKRVLDEAFSNE